MNRQDKATVREYREALRDGAWELAQRIRNANPDLFGLSEKVQHAVPQTEEK